MPRLDSPRRSAPERSDVDLAGPSSDDLRRALERDNLVLAEATAREIGRVTIRRGARAHGTRFAGPVVPVCPRLTLG
jgi:hypothetical protein